MTIDPPNAQWSRRDKQGQKKRRTFNANVEVTWIATLDNRRFEHSLK